MKSWPEVKLGKVITFPLFVFVYHFDPVAKSG